MKNILKVLVVVMMIGSMSVYGATVLQYSFEDGTAGQPMTTEASGGHIGSADISGNGRNFMVWGQTYGPSFSSAGDTPTGIGLSSSHVADKSSWPGSGQDGYTAALNTWAPLTWTIECAVKITNLTGWTTFIGRDGNGGDTGAALYFQKVGDAAIGNKFRINFVTVGGTRHILDSSVVAVADKWYRVAAKSDGTTLSICVNDGTGWTVNTLTMPAGSNALRATGNMTFGRGWWNNNFVDHLAGNLDDIRISDVALETSQLLPGGASLPNPANGATVPTATSQLSWINPENTGKCDVWFGAGDANALDYKTKLTKYEITGANVILPPARQTYPMPEPLSEGKYTWVVDCYRGSPLPAEPNSPGAVWSFTATEAPVIKTEPANQIVNLGQTAVFTTIFESTSPASIKWYKEAGAVDVEMDNPDDVDVTITTTSVGDTYTTTLSIANSAARDEGQFYCIVTNDGGTDTSVTVNLGVKHLMAYWTMNQGDFVGNQYLDVSTEDTIADNADPNNPAAVTFVDGPNSLGANSAVAINDSTFALADGALAPTQYTDQMTISAWIRLTGTLTATDGYGILTKGNAVVGNYENNIQWALYARDRGGPSVRLTSWAGGDAWSAENSIPTNEWVHVAASITQGRVANVYVNGVQSGYSDSNFVFGGNLSDPVRIGRYGAGGNNFPGEIDDIRVYNYGMDKHGIAELYYAVSGLNVCIDDYASTFDIVKNCKIDIADFAEFAKTWLDCGLYPATSCN